MIAGSHPREKYPRMFPKATPLVSRHPLSGKILLGDFAVKRYREIASQTHVLQKIPLPRMPCANKNPHSERKHNAPSLGVPADTDEYVL